MNFLKKPLNRYNSFHPGLREILILVILAVALFALAKVIGLHRMSDFLIYAVLVLALDLLYGYMGQLTFGIMLFFGTGTYAFAIFTQRVNSNPLLGMAAGIAAGALVALLVGVLTVRLRGPIFALANMGFNQIGFFLVAYPFPRITGGEDGMPVQVGTLGNIVITRQPVLFIFILICTLLVFLFLRKLTSSPLGVMARSIPVGENRIRHLGYNTRYYKLVIFVIAMTIAAFAGTLTSINYGFISPAYIDPRRNVEVIFAALIGGRGTLFGALFGGLIYMIMRNYVAIYIVRWETVMGLLLILIAFQFRSGIVGFIQNLFSPKHTGQDDEAGAVNAGSQAKVVEDK